MSTARWLDLFQSFALGVIGVSNLVIGIVVARMSASIVEMRSTIRSRVGRDIGAHKNSEFRT